VKHLFFLITILFANNLNSQSIIDKYYNDEELLIEKLVVFALENNPQVKVYAGRIELAKGNNSQAKLSWFNNVNLSYQFNPSYGTNSIDNSAPRFGLGLSVNLGNIINTPSRITQTENEINIAEADYLLNQQYLRAETIRRYSNYKRSIDLLKVREQAVNDSESSMLLLKHRFESGETTLEDFNKALRAYTDNKERRAESLGDILFHIASLEEIIGIKLKEIE
jgi:outer membrane protein TolC